MKITYVPKRFTKGHANTIARANEILESYAEKGILITLRSLYYRFVAKGYIPNKQKSYKRLGDIIGAARLAGRIDWNHLCDRTRSLSELQHYSGPQDALDKLTAWYHIDMWKDQEYRPEVWVEKDALSGVISGVCEENDIPYFVCRGYTSLSEMWRASLRLQGHVEKGQKPYIIHFGDHDPSGIDMSRDIYDRLHKTFMSDCEFVRVALTMEQIEEYGPPPNPAKITDSRYKTYVNRFGDESWELDSLEPEKFRELIEAQIAPLRDEKQWAKDLKARAKVKSQLKEIAEEWTEITARKQQIAELIRQRDELTKSVSDLDRAFRKLDELKDEERKASEGRIKGLEEELKSIRANRKRS